MNEQFKTAALAVKSIVKKGEGMWAALLLFAHEMSAGKEKPDLKPVFQAEERQASVELKVEMGKNSTYRAAKGTLVAAVKAGIPLVDADGNPRGKTAIENDVKALKEEKSELDKFKTSLNTATSIGAKLNAAERITAAKLVQELLDEMCKGIALAA